MAKTIVGLYDDNQEAERAQDALKDHDFKRGDISLIDQDEGDREKIVNKLVDSGVSDTDAMQYAQGVERGGYLVVVKTDDDRASEAVSLMNQFHPVDLDRRMQEWQLGSHQGGTPRTETETFVGNGSGRRASALGEETDFSEERSRTSSTEFGDTHQEKEKLEVAEEELHVGKRTVSGEGGIRARTYVTEHPVEEDIELRRETIDVERRPVDREVSGVGGELFREEEIEFTEVREEPVVEKRAHVIEEIIITKDVSTETETIRDTVRHQDVEIESLQPEFQSHYSQSFESSGSDYTFEDYSKGYRYGANLGSQPGYEGREWREIEPEARSHWEETNKGTWDEFKDSVRYGWERIRGREDESRPQA